MRVRNLALALALVALPAPTLAQNAADNTQRNERDRSGATLTPTDQGESEPDREITRAIRRALVADDGFSLNAKNVKIITQEGVVTLRGPVETAEEKARIGSLAAAPKGVRRVDNQIEIAGKN